MSMDNLKKNTILAPFNLLYRVSPELTLKILFRLKVGYPLNLEHPRTYNEKLQWIKLHDRNPLMAQCCDKYAVRSYVESKGCGKYLNDLLWQGFDPEGIPFDELPERYVVKVTHGLTFNIIVDGTRPVNRGEVVAECRKWLKAKFLPCYGEWFYGVERPRVIVEKYLEGDDGEALFDYKIFCFNGEPKTIYVDTWRDGERHINACDIDLNLFEGVKLGYPNDEVRDVKRPEALGEMLDVAKALSQDFHHVRVDLYYTHRKIFFGELAFTKGAGFGRIEPVSFDEKMGDWLQLPCDEVA